MEGLRTEPEGLPGRGRGRLSLRVQLSKQGSVSEGLASSKQPPSREAESVGCGLGKGAHLSTSFSNKQANPGAGTLLGKGQKDSGQQGRPKRAGRAWSTSWRSSPVSLRRSHRRGPPCREPGRGQPGRGQRGLRPHHVGLSSETARRRPGRQSWDSREEHVAGRKLGRSGKA